MNATVFIQDVFRITGVGIIPVGNVKDGTLKIGMKLNIDGKVMVVKSIEMHHQQIQEAHAGDNIGFCLENGDYELLKKVARTCITFSGEGAVKTQIIEKPEPIHPKGVFSELVSFVKNRRFLSMLRNVKRF